MKTSRHTPLSIIRQKFLLTCAWGLLALWANNALAATSYYWDINGPVAGAGGGNSPTGSWEGTNWTTSSSGTSLTGNWVEGSFPRFCAGTTATGVYTVTASASHTITGVYNHTPGTTIINGSGTLYLSYANSSGLAGFLVTDSLTISNVIADSGGSCAIEPQVQGAAPSFISMAQILTAAEHCWEISMGLPAS